MKKIFSSLLLTSLFSVSIFAQQDADGCKDSPMFPKRMPNYFISECKSNYDVADFNVVAGGSKIEHKEGTLTMVRYDFNTESGQQKPNSLYGGRNSMIKFGISLAIFSKISSFL